MLRLPISSGFEVGIPVRRYSVGLPFIEDSPDGLLGINYTALSSCTHHVTKLNDSRDHRSFLEPKEGTDVSDHN